MILVASQRSGASALSDHLMNQIDNEIVTVAEITGFVADDLHGALQESYAISKGTRCKQYLFSVSLNPPADQDVSEQIFFDAADRIEAKLGLSGQPRALVFHEKEGRRHAHLVVSRIDAETMKAINLPHFKTKLRDISRELFLAHGWSLPDGLATYNNASPLNFTLEQWQMSKRQGLDPREIKQTFQHAWEQSDGLTALKHALEDRGFFLARGDRRGFVALDVVGTVYSFAKWVGIKTKDINAKLGSPEHLPTVEATRGSLRSKVSGQMRTYIHQVKARHADQLAPIYAERNTMAQAHRDERKVLQAGQTKRWAEETAARQARFTKGLRGVWDWIRGKKAELEDRNVKEALACVKRDQAQRDTLITTQLRERRILQERLSTLRAKQAEDRKILARDIASSLRRLEQQHQEHSRSRRRGVALER